MSSLQRTKQGHFTIEDSYTIEDIQNGNYKLLSIEESLTNVETITIDENLYNQVKNGSIIDKTFTNDIACLNYNDSIVAIYQTYHKDKSKAKPFKMFIN
jgi:tRNA pseudouridine55 synthase